LLTTKGDKKANTAVYGWVSFDGDYREFQNGKIDFNSLSG